MAFGMHDDHSLKRQKFDGVSSSSVRAPSVARSDNSRKDFAKRSSILSNINPKAHSAFSKKEWNRQTHRPTVARTRSRSPPPSQRKEPWSSSYQERSKSSHFSSSHSKTVSNRFSQNKQYPSRSHYRLGYNQSRPSPSPNSHRQYNRERSVSPRRDQPRGRTLQRESYPKYSIQKNGRPVPSPIHTDVVPPRDPLLNSSTPASFEHAHLPVSHATKSRDPSPSPLTADSTATLLSFTPVDGSAAAPLSPTTSTSTKIAATTVPPSNSFSKPNPAMNSIRDDPAAIIRALKAHECGPEQWMTAAAYFKRHQLPENAIRIITALVEGTYVFFVQ